MGEASTTTNTAESLKRIYGPHTKGEKHPKDPNREWDGKQWTLVHKPESGSSTSVANTSKAAPSSQDHEDKPGDSPLVRASKKRMREAKLQRDAMKK